MLSVHVLYTCMLSNCLPPPSTMGIAPSYLGLPLRSRPNHNINTRVFLCSQRLIVLWVP